MSSKTPKIDEVRNIRQWITQHKPSSKIFAKQFLKNSGGEYPWLQKFDELVNSANFSWKNVVDTIISTYPRGYVARACREFEYAKHNFWLKVYFVLKRDTEEETFHQPTWSSRINSDFVFNLFACLDANASDVFVYENKNIFSKVMRSSIASSRLYAEKCIELCFTVHKSQRQLIWSEIQERLQRHREGKLVWGVSNFLRLARFRFVIVQKEAEFIDDDKKIPNCREEQKKFRVAFLKQQLLPLYKRSTQAVAQLQHIVEWFISGDARLTVLAISKLATTVKERIYPKERKKESTDESLPRK